MLKILNRPPLRTYSKTSAVCSTLTTGLTLTTLTPLVSIGVPTCSLQQHCSCNKTKAGMRFCF